MSGTGGLTNLLIELLALEFLPVPEPPFGGPKGEYSRVYEDPRFDLVTMNFFEK